MEYLLYFLIIFLAYMLGFGRGYNYREQIAVKRIHNILDDAASEVESKTIKLSIEKIGIMFYAYDADTRNFLGQGKSKKELQEALRLTLPNNNFIIDPDNLKEIGWSNE